MNRRSLGIAPQAGGEHARMGTRNRLLKLGDSLYLEVISPDPAAPKPGRPRWFQLDELQADAPPRLATWVVRTSDIHATLAACSEPLGNVESISSRAGPPFVNRGGSGARRDGVTASSSPIVGVPPRGRGHGGADRYPRSAQDVGPLAGREARRQEPVVDLPRHGKALEDRRREVEARIVGEAVGLR